MSLQKFMIVNAVPFGLARLQSNASKTIINISGGLGTADNNDFPVLTRLKKTSKKISHSPSLRMIKKRNKLLNHNSSSYMSQEKLKLQRGLLEQQLFDIKLEKMRLFVENEDLKLRCSSLEEENNFLRIQLQTSKNCHQDERNQMCEDTLKHASFVNIPQQKDWVLPQMITLLMITLGELLHSFQPSQLITFQLTDIYHIFKHWMKSVIPRPGLMIQMFLSSLCHKTSLINPQVVT